MKSKISEQFVCASVIGGNYYVALRYDNDMEKPYKISCYPYADGEADLDQKNRKEVQEYGDLASVFCFMAAIAMKNNRE